MLDENRTHFEIAIVGAGLSGLGAAIALQRDGLDDFVVLERADDLGGTWRDNTYPGCACDIPSVLYSFADGPNPGWSRAFAAQREIWDYMRDLTGRHRLALHLRFGHDLERGRWDGERQLWELETSHGRLTADVLISAAGALADPAISDRWRSRFARRRALALRRERGLAAIEPARHAQAQFIAEVDAGSEGSVWTAGGCLSWYLDVTGRNSTLWPGSVRAYQRGLAKFDASDWVTEIPSPRPAREPALA